MDGAVDSMDGAVDGLSVRSAAEPIDLLARVQAGAGGGGPSHLQVKVTAPVVCRSGDTCRLRLRLIQQDGELTGEMSRWSNRVPLGQLGRMLAGEGDSAESCLNAVSFGILHFASKLDLSSINIQAFFILGQNDVVAKSLPSRNVFDFSWNFLGRCSLMPNNLL